MVTRRQHYVWRYYLEAWQQENGSVNCLRADKIFATNPSNVMVERDFYKLSRITRADVEFIEAFVRRVPSSALRALHRNLIKKLVWIAHANDWIQKHEGIPVAEKSAAQAVVIEAEELLHGGIENEALPLLEELRQKRTGFLCNQETAITFFHFIAHQYFRTKRIRESIGKALSNPDPKQDRSHLKNLMAYFGATNVGASLFRDRDKFEIVFVENKTDRGFIAGDQPIVNLLATQDDVPPEELAFYYPLAPDLAIIVSREDYKLRALDPKTFEQLNDFVAWNSQHFLISDSVTILEKYTADRAHVSPPTCQLFKVKARC